jgi:uncharacterized protein YutE (UPF0331/DUF86 family)
MTFQDYLVKTVEIATEEKTILDELSSKMSLNKIEFRAAKSSLQTLIENAIGKAKKILKYYGCPVTPSRGRDAVFFMYELGLIEEEEFQALNAAISFRNSMIHDYMKFDESVLYAILREKRYMDIYQFLIEIPDYNETLKKRITTFTV